MFGSNWNRILARLKFKGEFKKADYIFKVRNSFNYILIYLHLNELSKNN